MAGKKEKNVGGRPTRVIDYDKLKVMVEMQAIGEECACVLQMDYEVLNHNLQRDGHGGFKDYFKKHSGTGKISLRRAQFRSAIEGKNVTMQIWLGKQHLGQADKVDNFNTNKELSDDDYMKELHERSATKYK
jgi:hypothetical protein